jgi:hypothetical protein
MSEVAEAGYERFSPGCGTRHITLKWLPEFNAIWLAVGACEKFLAVKKSFAL